MFSGERGFIPTGDFLIADLRDDIPVAQPRKRACGLLAEQGADLDRIDHPHERREHGCLISAAGPDLQHAIGRFWLQFLGHVRHDERPGDGLRRPDRQRHVEIGEGPLRRSQEFMPGSEPHAFENARVGHSAAGDVVADHPFAGLGESIDHRRRGSHRPRGRRQTPRRDHHTCPSQWSPCGAHDLRLTWSVSYLAGRILTNSISKIRSSFGSMTGGDPSSP